MLNIISKSIYDREIRGPKKVVDNLIKGLDIIGYPYVINQRLDSAKKLWIHDDICAFNKMDKLPPFVHTLAGPNLFLVPQEIPVKLTLPNTVYLQPSENTKKVWLEKGYNKSPTEVWPVGIDTSHFQTSKNTRNKILIYYKQRQQQELDYVVNLLQNLKLDCSIIKYGSYNENQYINEVSNSKYVIWLGCYESQGIALLETLSINIPILVIDKKPESNWENESTSAPYFDNRCGIKISNIKLLSEKITYMEKQWSFFEPRKYVEENLSLTKQARDMIFLYDKYFNLSFENGFKEKTIKNGKWKNATLLYRAYFLSKNIIKHFFTN